jgi:hypothetical protein
MSAPVRTQEEDHRITEAGRGDKHASISLDRQALLERSGDDLAGKYQFRTQSKDHSALVNEIRRMGRCVVVATGPACCSPGDAIVGTRISLIGDFASRDEAEALANEDQGYQDADLRIDVLSPIPPQGEIERIIACRDER